MSTSTVTPWDEVLRSSDSSSADLMRRRYGWLFFLPFLLDGVRGGGIGRCLVGHAKSGFVRREESKQIRN